MKRWPEILWVLITLLLMALIMLDTMSVYAPPPWLVIALLIASTIGMVLLACVVLGGMVIGIWSDKA